MIKKSEMYTEVFELLSYMDKTIVMKIPVEILEYIKQNRDSNYKVRIDKEDIFNPNNLDKTTISFITALTIKYIADDKEKQMIIDACKENDLKSEKVKKEQYDVNVFKKEKVEMLEKNVNKTEGMALEVKKHSIFEKIKLFIKRLLN